MSTEVSWRLICRDFGSAPEGPQGYGFQSQCGPWPGNQKTQGLCLPRPVTGQSSAKLRTGLPEVMQQQPDMVPHSPASCFLFAGPAASSIGCSALGLCFPCSSSHTGSVVSALQTPGWLLGGNMQHCTWEHRISTSCPSTPLILFSGSVRTNPRVILFSLLHFLYWFFQAEGRGALTYREPFHLSLHSLLNFWCWHWGAQISETTQQVTQVIDVRLHIQ